MGGRGRGRGGRGGNSGISLNREQLSAIGIAPGENFQGPPITEPPPLYPPLNRKPVPLTESIESDYLLILRQHFLDHMHTSGAYLRPLNERKIKSHQALDTLLEQLRNVREKFNWELFPAELRPKVVPKRVKTKDIKEVDVESRLNQLEKLEETNTEAADVTVKQEVDNEEEEDYEQENYEDEDVDDGTDYANNYFDNGEAYEDEDDNLDDGPIY